MTHLRRLCADSIEVFHTHIKSLSVIYVERILLPTGGFHFLYILFLEQFPQNDQWRKHSNDPDREHLQDNLLNNHFLSCCLQVLHFLFVSSLCFLLEEYIKAESPTPEDSDLYDLIKIPILC